MNSPNFGIQIVHIQFGPFEYQNFWSSDFKWSNYRLGPICWNDHPNTGPMIIQFTIIIIIWLSWIGMSWIGIWYIGVWYFGIFGRKSPLHNNISFLFVELLNFSMFFLSIFFKFIYLNFNNLISKSEGVTPTNFNYQLHGKGLSFRVLFVLLGPWYCIKTNTIPLPRNQI